MNEEPKLTLSEIPPKACPFCRHVFHRALHVTDAVKPGQLALCPECYEVVEIGPDLELKKPSAEKLLNMKAKAFEMGRLLAKFAKRMP